MRHQTYALPIPTVDGTRGASVKLNDLTAAAVYVHQSGVMNVSLKVQAKAQLDVGAHDNWVDLDTITNANKLVQIPNGYTHVAIFRTSATSSGVAAVVTGKNARSE